MFASKHNILRVTLWLMTLLIFRWDMFCVGHSIDVLKDGGICVKHFLMAGDW